MNSHTQVAHRVVTGEGSQ